MKLLTTLMTEICGWRAFPTARTAKHFRKCVRIVTYRYQENSITASRSKNVKFLIPTPRSFTARSYFWSFNLQQLVLKICSNYFKFAATLFNLQQLYFICNSVSICSMSLVGQRRQPLAISNLVISLRFLDENGKEMCHNKKNVKRMCGARTK